MDRIASASVEETLPGDLLEVLQANPEAEKAWNNLTAIGRRDFLRWIGEAKQAETRARRIRICGENLVKGKKRPCCFAVVPMDLYKALGEDADAKKHWSALDANEKRDFSDWIEGSPDKATRKERVVIACQLLCAGKRAPSELRAMEEKSASKQIDSNIKSLADWRGETLSRVRKLIKAADPEVIEEVKWVKPSNPNGVPVWSHNGIICTGETYKDKVKFTFAKGASVPDPTGIFNSSLDAGTRRALDIFEGDKLDEAAFKDLIQAAVALNLK